MLLVPIPVSSSADGPSPCCVVVEAATSTPFMALKAIVAWRPRPAWLVLISVYSAGGQYPYGYPMVIIISCKVYMYIVTVQRKIFGGKFKEFVAGKFREILEGKLGKVKINYSLKLNLKEVYYEAF